MIIPNKIKILGKWVNVKLIKGDSTTFGEWDSMSRTIKLKNTPDLKDDLPEILMHEIFEVISERCDLKMSHITISTLSEVLYAIIVDNKLDFSK